MSRYAIVEGGSVLNTIECDPATVDSFRSSMNVGVAVRPVPDGQPVEIGWSDDGAAFHPPPSPRQPREASVDDRVGDLVGELGEMKAQINSIESGTDLIWERITELTARMVEAERRP